MPSKKFDTYTLDMDDLIDANASKAMDALGELRTRVPGLKVTLFTIPRRTSTATIEMIKRECGDYVQLAPHGWHHTRGECLAWTDVEARDKIEAAKEMGIDAPIFRAPGWLLDGHVYEACKELGYVVASHREHRVFGTGVREFIYNDLLGRRGGRKTKCIHGHITPVSGNHILDMMKDGRLEFPQDAHFEHLQNVAVVYGQ